MIRARAALSSLCFLIGLLIALSTLSFPVYAGLPDLTVDSIWLERASAPGVPVAGTDLALNESFNIVASIKNIGQEAANGYYLDAYYDSDYGRGGPDNITAGEVQEWYVGPLTATAGTHTTQWVVDPDNQIAELDEQNNMKQYTFTIGSSPTQTTTNSTSVPETNTTSTATISATVIQNSTSYSYEATTTTVTSYSTSTSTSTIPTVTTVILVPLTVASTVQGTQLLSSTLTTTVTSYTSTQALTSTVVVPTTATLAPLATTSSVQARQVQTSTGTTTVTKYTTVTTTVYTGTTTSTSTRVVYTTATSLASAGVSSPLAYLGFISLLAVTFGRVIVGKGLKIPKVRSWTGGEVLG